jgi:hypothetical protein
MKNIFPEPFLDLRFLQGAVGKMKNIVPVSWSPVLLSGSMRNMLQTPS